jgi:hypothetical protein
MPAARVDGALELDALAVEQDLAFVGHGGARQRLDQAGLARAVVADHGQDLAGAQFKVGAVERGDLPVALDQALGLHDQWSVRCVGGVGHDQRTPLRELVGGHGQDHEDAGDQDLVDRRHAHQREPVAEHAHNQRPHQRAQDDAAPAKQAGAAQHHSADGVEVFRSAPRSGRPPVRATDSSDAMP